MRLFADRIAFVDLETTGTRAAVDRITEVGIVTVTSAEGDDAPAVTTWSTLVDPETPIPPEIQALTGITDAMVRGAPSFASIAGEIESRLAGAVFVAHNARFDHGFLKHEFARIGRPFSARALCTVKLSRRLDPEAASHGLDAIILRHGLAVADRHRALGDAQALWAFVRALYAAHPADAIEAAVQRILRIPSLPPQLPTDALDALPEAPGVYLFYGANPLPLYIGKSVNLRERVAAHFSADWQSETDLRLSAEIRRIEHEATAGELGALLREAALVKQLMPAHNRALRRKAEAGVLRLDGDAAPEFVRAAAVEPAELGATYGPFGSARAARQALREIAGERGLCWTRLGLERRAAGPCFARQLRRCAGFCTGDESAEAHDKRLREGLARHALPPWPFAAAAAIRERSANGARTEVHLLRDWCWLGSASDEGDLARLVEAPPRPRFDPDVAKLLLKTWRRAPTAFVPAG